MKNKILVLILLLFAFSALSYFIYFKKEAKIAPSLVVKKEKAVPLPNEKVKKSEEKPEQLTKETLPKKAGTQTKAAPSVKEARKPAEKQKTLLAKKTNGKIKKGTRAKHSKKKPGKRLKKPSQEIVKEAKVATPKGETKKPPHEDKKERPIVAPQKIEPLKEEPMKPVESPKTEITARPSPEIKKETVVAQLKEEAKKPGEQEPQKEITDTLPKADVQKPDGEPGVIPAVSLPEAAIVAPKAATVPPVKITPEPLTQAAAPVIISQKESYKLSSEEKEHAGTQKKIALLPFENFTDSKDALTQVTPLLRSRLEKKGLGIVDENNLNRFLCNERVRATGHISKEMAQKIEKELSTNAIMAGAIISYSSGENPQISLLARLIDPSTGLIIWANYASVTSDDFTTILGLGRINNIEDLTSRAVDILLASFNTSPPQKDPETLYRIAVMPFQNRSKHKSAGVIAMYMFLVELFKNEIFEPVEYGDVRKIVVELRIRDKSEMDYKTMEALSKRSGAGGILLGAVEQFNESTDASSPPKVTMTARLLDARKNKILWYNTQQSTGEKDIIAFEWAEKKPVDRVAYKSVLELVRKMKTAKWQ
ncbi:MAG: hypothetical protein HY808_14405 [Nitrospirae bacterium]|nr:hypothetical protein [Nitrospirota bacterium]